MGDEAGKRNAPTASSSARKPVSPLHQRSMHRAATASNAEMTHSLPQRRRSSIMTTDSVDRQSFKSSTDDLLRPSVSRSGLQIQQPDEGSLLHSAPLGLALLPAVAGLAFQNGSAIVTDISLLVLAAILLNWSIRLPWDWYQSAQAIQSQDSVSTDDFFQQHDIITEEHVDEAMQDSSAPTPSSSKPPEQSNKTRTVAQESAASELRVHELLALVACFLGPLLGALLLHSIRSQLSRPSEGLVSNYNLTIFLLASELRPLSHLIKMVQNRTLHLQKTLASNPYVAASISPSQMADHSTRLDELEAYVASNASASATRVPQNQAEIVAQVRKTQQPDIDALNRALRRYEKRLTVLAMQVDGRLNQVEARTGDAITLVAAAERSAAAGRRSNTTILLDWTCAMVVKPVQFAVWFLSLPGQALGVCWLWLRDFVLKRFIVGQRMVAGRSRARSQSRASKKAPGTVHGGAQAAGAKQASRATI